MANVFQTPQVLGGRKVGVPAGTDAGLLSTTTAAFNDLPAVSLSNLNLPLSSAGLSPGAPGLADTAVQQRGTMVGQRTQAPMPLETQAQGRVAPGGAIPCGDLTRPSLMRSAAGLTQGDIAITQGSLGALRGDVSRITTRQERNPATTSPENASQRWGMQSHLGTNANGAPGSGVFYRPVEMPPDGPLPPYNPCDPLPPGEQPVEDIPIKSGGESWVIHIYRNGCMTVTFELNQTTLAFGLVKGLVQNSDGTSVAVYNRLNDGEIRLPPDNPAGPKFGDLKVMIVRGCGNVTFHQTVRYEWDYLDFSGELLSRQYGKSGEADPPGEEEVDQRYPRPGGLAGNKPRQAIPVGGGTFVITDYPGMTGQGQDDAAGLRPIRNGPVDASWLVQTRYYRTIIYCDGRVIAQFGWKWSTKWPVIAGHPVGPGGVSGGVVY